VNPTYDYACQKGGSLTTDSAILPIAANLDSQIDMIVSGHTHAAYVCNVPDPKGQQRLVTSAASFGRLFTETSLKYDTRTQDIVRSSVTANNMIVTRDVKKANDESKIIKTYSTLIAPIANKELGKITADITREQNAAGESTLGDLIADAQVNDPSVVTGDQTHVVAFMNPGRYPRRPDLRQDGSAGDRGWHRPLWRGVRSPAVQQLPGIHGYDRCRHLGPAGAAVAERQDSPGQQGPALLVERHLDTESLRGHHQQCSGPE